MTKKELLPVLPSLTNIANIVERSLSLEIKTQQDMEEAGDLLSKMNVFNDAVVAYKEAKTKPLNAALAVIRNETRDIETKNKEIITALRNGMSAWQTKQVEETQIEADNIASRVGEGKGKFKAETASKKIDALATPDQKIVSTAGAVSFTKVRVFEVTDITKLPAEYILPNETKIRADMKQGIELKEGIIYRDEQQVINRRA